MLDQTHPSSAASAFDAIPDTKGHNAWQSDPTMKRLLVLYLEPDILQLLEPRLDDLGALVGSRLDALAQTADANPPQLRHRDRRGAPDDQVLHHPAYKEMERLAFGELGLASMSHRPGTFGAASTLPPTAKYALTFLFAQSEFGLLCPVNMTDSLARTLKRYGSPELIERYLDGMGNQDPDRLLQGAMFMTEQAAGSDIAATTVDAIENDDGSFALHGLKWFCSNPDADVALVLARRKGAEPGMRGVSLFLLPRRLHDGRRNAYRIVRLKDKLGTRSMASGEISLDGATAWLVGDPSAGFKQMADMVNSSRLSNGVRSAALMRRAMFEALHVARNRTAFGRRLIDMPLMQRQLVKMLTAGEQARTMFLQAAQAMQHADSGTESAARLLRILTPLIKFRACRDARKVTGDAMEVRGGCGYIEEWVEPRLLRDAHLGSIWEGTSNIVALDVIRAVKREGGLDAWNQWVDAHSTRSMAENLKIAVKRTNELVERATGDDAEARTAASALYNVGSSAAMSWEAEQLGDSNRAVLANLVLQHRVFPFDPLAENNAGDGVLLRLLEAA